MYHLKAQDLKPANFGDAFNIIRFENEAVLHLLTDHKYLSDPLYT